VDGCDCLGSNVGLGRGCVYSQGGSQLLGYTWEMPTRGRVLATIVATPFFILGFDVIPYDIASTQTSLLHITDSGQECCDPGDRMPMVGFEPDSFRLVVNFLYAQGETACRSSKSLRASTKTRVTIRVGPFHVGNSDLTNVRLQVFFENELVCEAEDIGFGQADATSGVTVYAGSPWRPPANANLANVDYGAMMPTATIPDWTVSSSSRRRRGGDRDRRDDHVGQFVFGMIIVAVVAVAGCGGVALWHRHKKAVEQAGARAQAAPGTTFVVGQPTEVGLEAGQQDAWRTQIPTGAPVVVTSPTKGKATA